MRTDQLLYFLDLAQSGSINKTADHFYISHQAISSAIKRLEQELNTLLFDRTKSGVSLTEQGAYFLPLASQIIEVYTNTLDHFSSTPPSRVNNMKAPFTIFAPPRLLDTFLSESINTLCKKFPNLSLSVKSLEATNIINSCNAYDEHQLSFLAIHDPVKKIVQDQIPQSLELITITSEKLYACINRNCAQLNSFSHLQKSPEILDVSHIPIIGFEYNLFSEDDSQRKIDFQVNTLNSIIQLIKDNRGTSIITNREYIHYFKKYKELQLFDYKGSTTLHFCCLKKKDVRFLPSDFLIETVHKQLLQ